MSAVFISYARSSEEQAKQVANALRDAGYAVWRDDELPAHRTYAEVIEERLQSAKAVVVLWSADATSSQWVRAEADAARELGTLVQASIDGTMPPIPFNQIQYADLKGWSGDDDHSGWRKLKASVAALAGDVQEAEQPVTMRRQKTSVCVLPFVNMSGEAEQEYFSDGISEDITTDLSKVSALEVIARNTAFMFKGQAVDVSEVAKKLGVSHVLEGSVRKAGSRVRITAQLIDGRSGAHVWADRYDRDLTDVFAIQDEISKAIVAALELKLLPEEKKEIEKRGTSSVEAYNLYLMARQLWISGNLGDLSRDEGIVRICLQATVLDESYAQAWALMALAQSDLRFWHGKPENPLPAAERAISIDPTLAEAHCVKARYLQEEGHQEDANAQVEIALRLDPESWEVNREAAALMFRQGRIREAAVYFEKATALVSSDYHSPSMLQTCYHALADEAALLRTAATTLERTEATVVRDPTNASALADGAFALGTLGQRDRAKEWAWRALLLAPDNLRMRYNLGCAFAVRLDTETALEIMEPFFERVSSLSHINHLEVDPDFDALRSNPEFQKMLSAAKARLGADASQ